MPGVFCCRDVERDRAELTKPQHVDWNLLQRPNLVAARININRHKLIDGQALY